MPRVRVRTTQRGKVDQQVYRGAFSYVRRGECMRAAEVHGVCHVTQFRYCKRRAGVGGQQARAPGYRAHNKVFTEEQKKRLQGYIKRAADIYFGLSPQDVGVTLQTGTPTVQVPDKIIATKGQRQVGAVTSGERGTLVTVAFAANTQGNFFPPYFVFPRKKFQHHFFWDWSPWLHWFCQRIGVDAGDRLLLLLDNHPSHLSVVAIDFCKSHGIGLLSFPPHCSHCLQPLDRSVFGPLKHYINSAADSWMRMNPGRTLTIYNIPSLVAKALPQAATASSISSRFECTNIWPLNPDIFSETVFAPAFVTDRPAPAPAPAPSQMPVPAPSPAPSSSPMSASSPAPSSSPMSASSPAPSSSPMSAPSPAPASLRHQQPSQSLFELYESAISLDGTSSGTPIQRSSPEKVRPYPKAGSRKEDNRRGRKRSTVKAALEEETRQKG